MKKFIPAVIMGTITITLLYVIFWFHHELLFVEGQSWWEVPTWFLLITGMLVSCVLTYLTIPTMEIEQ